MTHAELPDFFQRYIAALNTHEFHRLADFMHDDLLVNGQAVSRDQMRAELDAHVAAVPDLVWHIEDFLIGDDRVAAHMLNSGTPIQEWLNAKPTGAKVEYAEHVFHRVRDGRFHELHFLFDTVSIQEQLARGSRP